MNRDTSRNEAFSSITNKLVIFENILLDRGGGGQISTPIYRDTEPGVSCAKIGNQTCGINSTGRKSDPFLKTSKLVNDGECKMERYHLLMLIF